MKHAILGAGKIGLALARAFVRKQIQVGIANSRGPETLAHLAEKLGENLILQSVAEACTADILWLAVPFHAYADVAKQKKDWTGHTIVDLTNAFGVSADALGGRYSSEVVAAAFPGARLVKGFNHLPAAQLGKGDAAAKQVVFIASNDPEASAEIASVAEQLEFAPVQLGRLNEGGVPLHIVDGKPGGLIFQNVAKVSQGPTRAQTVN